MDKYCCVSKEEKKGRPRDQLQVDQRANNSSQDTPTNEFTSNLSCYGIYCTYFWF